MRRAHVTTLLVQRKIKLDVRREFRARSYRRSGNLDSMIMFCAAARVILRSWIAKEPTTQESEIIAKKNNSCSPAFLRDLSRFFVFPARSLAHAIIFRRRIFGTTEKVSESLLESDYQVPGQTAPVRRHGFDRIESALYPRAM